MTATFGNKTGGVYRCFFFQAEDGIRDLTVTGVQTCALPIYPAGQTDVARGEKTHGQGNALTILAHKRARAVSARLTRQTALDMDTGLPGSGSRSEERRVGKECRSRWSPYH